MIKNVLYLGYHNLSNNGQILKQKAATSKAKNRNILLR